MNLRHPRIFIVTALTSLLLVYLTPTSANSSGTFNVLIWQDMSLNYDLGYVSGHSSNTFMAVMGTCDQIKDDACIAKVEFKRDSNSAWVPMLASKMTFDETACRSCTGQTFGVWGRDSRGRPNGDITSRWTADNVTIIVESELLGRFTQGKEVNNPSWDSPETKFDITGISLKINSSNLNSLKDSDFRITLNLKDRTDAARGFFTGRLRDTDLQVTPNGEFIVQGKPVVVTTARTKSWPNFEIPDEIIEFFKVIYAKTPWGVGIPEPSLWKSNSAPVGFSFGNFMNTDFPTFDFFERYFEASETRDYAAWSLTNGNWANFLTLNPCFINNQTAGLATTNANMFTPGLPTWDASSQNLEFRMASPHVDQMGKLTTGNYDLILKEEIAKCIWGLKTIPSTATLIVSYPDGTADVGTVVFGARNGFVNFHVNGFHFSSPTIKIKLDAPKPKASDIPSPTPTETKATEQFTPTPAKQTTIKCKKGSKFLKKTAISPKCPSGYQKVS